VIKELHEKLNYSISAICRVLKVPKSTYYYKEIIVDESALIAEIKEIFRISREIYGARKIKIELKKKGIITSRRKIHKLMKQEGLVSVYTKPRKPKNNGKASDQNAENLVNRQFNNRVENEVIVSDLTYIRVGGRWCYLCVLLDLAHRMIVGSAVGVSKTAELVLSALYSTDFDLRTVKFFHSDRGSEFKNKFIDEVFLSFDITRSLSNKGSPYDNAVMESTNNILKTEFVKRRVFDTIEEFRLYWADYVNWYNNVRIHGSLGYLTPNESKKKAKCLA
jgi:transposase InsO family protein